MFLINQSDNILPVINNSSKDRKKELDTQWKILKAEAEQFINSDIPNFNKTLWSKGIAFLVFEKRQELSPWLSFCD